MDSAETELTIRGPLRRDEMEDVLAIAHVEGKKKLRCKRVRVKPFIEIRNNKDYIVKVTPVEG